MFDIATVRLERATGAVFNFVISSWLHSYLQSHRLHVAGGPMDADQTREYWRDHHAAVSRLVESTPIVLAHYAPEPDSFVGWACGEPGLCHWAYVKRGPWRRCGVAARLVEEAAGQGGAYSMRPLRDGVAQAFERRGWIYTPIEIGAQARNHGRREDREEEASRGREGPLRELREPHPAPPGHGAEHAFGVRVGSAVADAGTGGRLPDAGG
jgi:hypothetical protein